MPMQATVSAINWPFHHERQRLQIDERRRAEMHAQRLWRAIAGDETAQLAARRFHGDKRFARRRRKAFRENLEMVDERFHLRLHLLALRRNDARGVGLDRALVGDLVHGLANDFQALAHLRHAHQVPRIAIGFRPRGHVEIEFFVGGIREAPCDCRRPRPRRAGPGPWCS